MASDRIVMNANFASLSSRRLCQRLFIPTVLSTDYYFRAAMRMSKLLMDAITGRVIDEEYDFMCDSAEQAQESDANMAVTSNTDRRQRAQ